MKKMYLILTFILSSFFFSSSVFAVTNNFIITDEMFSQLDNLNTMINIIESSTPFQTKPYYIIAKLNNSYIVNFRSSNSSSSNTVYYGSNGLYFSTQNSYYLFYSDLSGIYQGGYLNEYNPYSSNFTYLYSNFDILCIMNGSGNVLNFNYNNDIYTINVQNNVSVLPSLYVLHDEFIGSQPADNYPILTEFYTVFIDKIKFTADYISYNYVFLSVFVVFLFMFAILLFRRLK